MKDGACSNVAVTATGVTVNRSGKAPGDGSHWKITRPKAIHLIDNGHLQCYVLAPGRASDLGTGGDRLEELS
jgi:hypothetical protein